MTGGGSSDSMSSWLELESDPGLFTLLVDDFGVKGVQVEEIYDLSKTLENSIFGFIFLFKWMERRNKRSKAASLDANSSYVTDPTILNKIFFAHQIVPNSCATHALLSVLLNCKSNRYFDLGSILHKFQRLCDGLSPENKGYAIGNQSKLAEAHNSYAKPENQINSKTNGQINDFSYGSMSSNVSNSYCPTSINTYHHQTSFNHSTISSNSSSAFNKNSGEIIASGAEIFHFICFVPINGRLYELDGLKPFPVDHGPFNIDKTQTANSSLNWTNKFKHIIRQRLSSFNNGQQNEEIRFNLMALVPDKMLPLSEQIDNMKYNFSLIKNIMHEFHDVFLNLNENELNIKNEPKANELNIKKDNEFDNIKDINSSNNSNNQNEETNSTIDLTPTTRQLRSSRVSTSSQNTTLKDTDMVPQNIPKNEFEINFIVSDSNKLDSKKSLTDLCKLHRIESLKYVPSHTDQQQTFIDLKDKENEIIRKIKLELSNENNEKLKYNDDDNTENEGVLIKKKTDFKELQLIESKLHSEIELEEARHNDEIDKRKKYKTDALRRKHVYDEFIVTYLKILNENGKLEELIRNKNDNVSNTHNSNCSSDKSTFDNTLHNHPMFLQQTQPSKKRRK